MDLKAVRSGSIVEFESAYSRSEVNAGTLPFIPGKALEIRRSALGLREGAFTGVLNPTSSFYTHC